MIVSELFEKVHLVHAIMDYGFIKMELIYFNNMDQEAQLVQHTMHQYKQINGIILQVSEKLQEVQIYILTGNFRHQTPLL